MSSEIGAAFSLDKLCDRKNCAEREKKIGSENQIAGLIREKAIFPS